MSNGGTPSAHRTDTSHLVPGDERYHDDKQFMARMTDLNGQISRYVLRHLDTDARRTAPTNANDERMLGMRLIRRGIEILERAERPQD
jgi:hypothetical protein